MRITLIFDDNTTVFLSGDTDKIAELIRGHDFKGFVKHEHYAPGLSKKELQALYKKDYQHGGAWNLDVLKKLLGETK